MKLRLSPLILVVAALLGTGCASLRQQEDPKCRRYIVAPPYNDDPKASDYIRQRWIEAVKPLIKSCDTFIPSRTADDAFALIDLTHDEEIHPRLLNNDEMTTLVRKTGATHLVLLHYRLGDHKIRIRSSIFGVLPAADYQRTAKLEKPIELPLNDSSPVIFAKNHRFFIKSLTLIPNAVESGFSSATLNNRRVTDKEMKEEEVHHHGALPPIVSAFQLTSIRPAYRYALFDWDWQWYLGTDFGYFDDSYSYTRLDKTTGLPVNPGQRETYAISLGFIAPTINGELSGHTPLGTTFLDFGWGPAVFSYKDSYGGQSGVSSLVIISVGHRVFMTERTYLVLSVDSATLNPPMVRNDIFIADGHVYSIFGIGYFWPEARSLLRSAF